jgi:hypothetical protein
MWKIIDFQNKSTTCGHDSNFSDDYMERLKRIIINRLKTYNYKQYNYKTCNHKTYNHSWKLNVNK